MFSIEYFFSTAAGAGWGLQLQVENVSSRDKNVTKLHPKCSNVAP